MTTPLLIVFCRGAMDGLNVLVPIDDPVYRAARPTLAMGETDVTRLDGDAGSTAFALTTALPRLAERHRAGRTAFLPAVGFAGQTRSHFAAQAALETGSGSLDATPRPAGTGWIGRFLSATATDDIEPFRAVGIGSAGVAPTLWGSPDVVSTSDLAALRLRERSPEPAQLAAAWTDSPNAVASGGAAGALAVLDRVGQGIGASRTGARGFGAGDDGAAFATASAVLAADLGTEVVLVNLGGWDTHAEQGTTAGRLRQRLTALDTGIGALLDRHEDGMTVLVVSEFGRRVAENSSGGTDHGAGGLVIAVGAGVVGGIHGDWPGLDDLQDGDLRPVNDLRAVQAEAVARVLGAPDQAEAATGVGSDRHLGLFV